ncbi:aminotransferase class I/II-fold pyridoxal phosphate-dependent enzyme [Roseomonas xinghualingensis]|uniref:aminotransferase class I/II-fold pyridoxal phosphate-dependent enzyme n=1 Tax=Roseomonas xinghualingensis TaxID=2986475 RepID=UPI0021F189A2|nr:aminotransferase class I/II-fold pyridoxal phosphate-dependent enzyme [Roseomonas sp. SXEYE001]MCV4209249.1 aminotransferase class I/II-fold pyridoxal phosphate-dependent enzyme [Roseomonas sp. SXEYE001]
MIFDRAGGTPLGRSLRTVNRPFPDAPDGLLDLSTAINPRPWPDPALPPPLPPEMLIRLPEPGAIRELEAVAAACYGAPSPEHVMAAPGTQLLLPMVAGLVPAGIAHILGPTYGEHCCAAALAGHAAREVVEPGDLPGGTLAMVVNPSNPDGRILRQDALMSLASSVQLLVVDEAYMEAGSGVGSMAPMAHMPRLVVLRSFGKFHGLAGLRLGFAIAAPEVLAPLRAMLGRWSISGPALAYAVAALADTEWAETTRVSLRGTAARLDAVLRRHRLRVMGGTSLFRFVRCPEGTLEGLGQHSILAKPFPDRPGFLRFGLPPDDPSLARLDRALEGVIAPLRPH